MEKPLLLSIIIPSFKQAEELRGALASVAEQKFRDFEIIIVDGGSKDKTQEVVSSYDDVNIRFYSEPDDGIYDAMNKGVKLSSGKFVYFMGCDDRFASSNALDAIFNVTGIREFKVIYGNAFFVNSKKLYDGKFSSFKLIKKNICHQAMFMQRDVFDRIGFFNLSYKIMADWEHNMRWFRDESITRKYIPITVALYNDAGASSYTPDDNFWNELHLLREKYFSYSVNYVYNRMNHPLVLKLFKVLSMRT